MLESCLLQKCGPPPLLGSPIFAKVTAKIIHMERVGDTFKEQTFLLRLGGKRQGARFMHVVNFPVLFGQKYREQIEESEGRGTPQRV